MARCGLALLGSAALPRQNRARKLDNSHFFNSAPIWCEGFRDAPASLTADEMRLGRLPDGQLLLLSTATTSDDQRLQSGQARFHTARGRRSLQAVQHEGGVVVSHGIDVDALIPK